MHRGEEVLRHNRLQRREGQRELCRGEYPRRVSSATVIRNRSVGGERDKGGGRTTPPVAPLDMSRYSSAHLLVGLERV